MKVVAKNVFGVVVDVMAQKCGCTKTDYPQINNCWECIIKKNMINVMRYKKSSYLTFFNNN